MVYVALALPPLQALNNKANMIFDAHTVDIEISAGEDKLLRCMMGRRRSSRLPIIPQVL